MNRKKTHEIQLVLFLLLVRIYDYYFSFYTFFPLYILHQKKRSLLEMAKRMANFLHYNTLQWAWVGWKKKKKDVCTRKKED